MSNTTLIPTHLQTIYIPEAAIAVIAEELQAMQADRYEESETLETLQKAITIALHNHLESIVQSADDFLAACQHEFNSQLKRRLLHR